MDALNQPQTGYLHFTGPCADHSGEGWLQAVNRLVFKTQTD